MNCFDLWLADVKISNCEKTLLIRRFNDSQNLLYHISDNQIRNICSQKTIDTLLSTWNEDKYKKLCDNLLEKGIETVNITENIYPYRLKNINDAPFLLFYKGNIQKLNENKSAAIVGSRKSTYYGKNISNLISRELSTYNINIISGLAAGIDGFAHKSCLDAEGYTCAVLGSGIDVIYPKKNTDLYNDIGRKGCLLSEYMPGTPPYAYNFPYRNRIISGLSDIVIVIEAGYKSGSLITANAALNQGKDVMAVPGSVFSEMSKGTNELIKDGAYVFTCTDDILYLLGIDWKKKIKNNVSHINISADEQRVIKFIGSTPVHIDNIIKLSNIDIKQLYELLFELQLKNEIICLAGNYYAKIQNEL